MDWPIILLGVVVGLMIVGSSLKKEERQRSLPSADQPASGGVGQWPPIGIVQPLRPWTTYTGPVYPPRPASPQPVPSSQVFDETVSSRTLVGTWRRSVVGLVRLAQRNVMIAKQRLRVGDCRTAVDAAVTSVENVSRALLHCYGEKPQRSSGQEEALKLLCLRFKGKEKVEFERAVEEVVRLHHNKVVQRYLQTHNLGTFLFNRTRASVIVDSASRTVALFAQIIDEHFATEIPELREACPKCHGLDVLMWSFSNGAANYTCNLCGHRWIELQTV
jgi:uncharacterized protein (UPF0332 family)